MRMFVSAPDANLCSSCVCADKGDCLRTYDDDRAFSAADCGAEVPWQIDLHPDEPIAVAQVADRIEHVLCVWCDVLPFHAFDDLISIGVPQREGHLNRPIRPRHVPRGSVA